ncbi:MAG: ABC transporter permease subunit, partial [Bacteroidota bacterium]
LPIFLHSPENYAIILTLIVSGILLTLMFTAIALLISSKFDDKTMGLGIAFLFWFGFSFLYDGLILLIAILFQNYPLEYPLIVLSFLNPIDLARIVVMLKLDSAALMGYTGAVFENFFGHNFGLILSLFILIIWSILPYLTAFRIFRKKNF